MHLRIAILMISAFSFSTTRAEVLTLDVKRSANSPAPVTAIEIDNIRLGMTADVVSEIFKTACRSYNQTKHNMQNGVPANVRLTGDSFYTQEIDCLTKERKPISKVVVLFSSYLSGNTAYRVRKTSDFEVSEEPAVSGIQASLLSTYDEPDKRFTSSGSDIMIWSYPDQNGRKDELRAAIFIKGDRVRSMSVELYSQSIFLANAKSTSELFLKALNAGKGSP